MIQAILAMNPVILIVIGILIFFSVVSWTIIIFKLLLIRKIKKAGKAFADFFWGTKDFTTIEGKIDEHRNSPLAAVFEEGYKETKHFLKESPIAQSTKTLSTDMNAMGNISRSLRKVSSKEVEKLEKDISFLATTAATTPFIGLFGTVWGIMNAFQSIGEAGSTSLSIVAPGISEALITTAIGLAVAIPAAVGFNYIQNAIRLLINEVDNFTYDFLNIVQKLFNTRE
jgi:biopolymer transport protein TolQ